jgi:hypothetical protein
MATRGVVLLAVHLAVGRAATQAPEQFVAIAEADCTSSRLGTAIDATRIGEPVSALNLDAPRWIPATPTAPAVCSIDGAMLPVDSAATARPINFRVMLPASWTRRAAQIGVPTTMTALRRTCRSWGFRP